MPNRKWSRSRVLRRELVRISFARFSIAVIGSLPTRGRSSPMRRPKCLPWLVTSPTRPWPSKSSRAGRQVWALDTLINNAGIFIGKPFTEYTEDDFTRKISVNLAGFFYVSQCAVRQMLKQGSGHIVNMTTTLVGQPVKSVPSALASLTKGGLDAVTRSLAIEYADKGIRVNAVAPGVIKTPMHAPETHDFLAKLHPMGRMGETREVVEAIHIWSRPGS